MRKDECRLDESENGSFRLLVLRSLGVEHVRLAVTLCLIEGHCAERGLQQVVLRTTGAVFPSGFLVWGDSHSNVDGTGGTNSNPEACRSRSLDCVSLQ